MSQAIAEDVSEAPESSQSLTVATSESARQRRKIAALEEKLQLLESGHAVKQRYEYYNLHLFLFIHYYFQGDKLLHVERKSHSACRYII
jgi:hypothetical protein